MNAESLKPILTLVVVVAFNVANAVGFALDAGLLYNILFSVISLVGVVYTWWKNQNVTLAAQQAQEYLDQLKGKGNYGELNARSL